MQICTNKQFTLSRHAKNISDNLAVAIAWEKQVILGSRLSRNKASLPSIKDI
jgi:hypothetical protein